jgi:hypothetical protein
MAGGGEKALNHPSYSTYVKGCRCAECRECARLYRIGWLKRRNGDSASAPEDAPLHFEIESGNLRAWVEAEDYESAMLSAFKEAPLGAKLGRVTKIRREHPKHRGHFEGNSTSYAATSWVLKKHGMWTGPDPD